VLLSILFTLFGVLASPLPTTQGDQTSQVHVAGRFVDAEGKPVRDVEVTGRLARDGRFVARTDEHGRLEVSVEWTDIGRDPTFFLTARHPRFSRWSHHEPARAGETIDVGRVVLEPGGVLRGHVMTEDGRPLEETEVLLIDADEHGPPASTRTTAFPRFDLITDQATSNADGGYRIVGVPPGRWCVLARHETTFRHASEVVTVSAMTEVELTTLCLASLPGEYRIEGVVSDEAGVPLPLAVVKTAGIRIPETGRTLTAQAMSRADGSFQLYLPRLPDDAIDLRVESPDGLHDDAYLDDVRPGARDVIVELGAMRVLNLLVLDEHDRPVEEYGWSLQINRSGRSIRTGVPPAPRAGGRATLLVPDHPLQIRIRTLAHDDDPTPVRVGALPELVTIRLEPLPVITGRVTFEGRAMGDVPVELVCRDPNRLDVVEGHWSGLYYGFRDKGFRTDRDGRFRIPNDFPNITYYVRSAVPGHAPGLSKAVRVGDPAVDVELKRGGSLDGVVVLPDGLDRSGIGLEVLRREPRRLGKDVGGIFNAAADEAGRFRFDQLSEGAWLVKVSVPRTTAFELGWSGERRVECEQLPFVAIVRDGVTTKMTFDLDRPLCVLEGRFTVEEQILGGDCMLLLEGPQALRIARAYLDTEGRFRLTAREPGTYRLAIDAGSGHYGSKIVTDLVRLQPGDNEWIRELPGELWKGKGVRLDPE